MCTSFLENPLILENICQHLDAKDALHLCITNAPFTKEERFIDTVNIFLCEKKQQHEAKKKKFYKYVYTQTRNFTIREDTTRPMGERIFQMKRVYNYINENRSFIEMNSGFKRKLKIMLFDHINSDFMKNYAFYYLGEIFGLFCNSIDVDDGNVVKYIYFRKNSII
jgi:hypothetical protein